MNFCKAYLLSFLAVFLLSATKTVVEATQSQEDSNPVVKSSKKSASSCYDFTMEIETRIKPEGFSWEIENANTGETIASQDEGFYTEEFTIYTHDEPICLDMDNSDICYKVVFRDDDYSYTSITLRYEDEEHNDEYSIWYYAIGERIVCGFDDFYNDYGCLYSDPEPSCECGDIAYCVSDAILLVFSFSYLAIIAALIVVCFPCWAVPLWVFLLTQCNW